jgi:hypothetical protein
VRSDASLYVLATPACTQMPLFLVRRKDITDPIAVDALYAKARQYRHRWHLSVCMCTHRFDCPRVRICMHRAGGVVTMSMCPWFRRGVQLGLRSRRTFADDAAQALRSKNVTSAVFNNVAAGRATEAVELALRELQGTSAWHGARRASCPGFPPTALRARDVAPGIAACVDVCRLLLTQSFSARRRGTSAPRTP